MTSSSTSLELERLLNQVVDGDLSDADESALQRMLCDNPAARQRYLHFMQMHAELHWNHGAASSLLMPPDDGQSLANHSRQTTGTQVGRLAMLTVAVGAIAAALLFVATYLKTDNNTVETKAPTIANMELIRGSATFRMIGSESLLRLADGRSLPAGTLHIEGETSVAQWRFLDGTLVTLTGDAEVDIKDNGQKLLNVRFGTLTAEVQPQPDGAPLVIETPTARVEVLGTVFTLVAESDQTQVNVDEGQVRMRRLVDGRSVEVRQDHSCTVSLDARHKLRADVPNDSTSTWRHLFTEPPPQRWKGQWLPPSGALPARLRAVACLVGRKQDPDYTPLIHYGITARKVDGMSLGSLPESGSLRVRFRTQQPTRLQIMLGLHRRNGRFGGNFEVKLPRDSATPRNDGWQELVVPLADFQPLVSRYPKMGDNAKPYLILITTFEDDAGLEVSELAIEPNAQTNSSQREPR